MAKIFNREELKNIIHDYISKLEGKIKLDKVILFGSYAKGTANKWSDIDLLIVSSDLPEKTPKGKNGFNLDNIVGTFEPSLEVLGINPKKLNDPIEKGFFDEITKSGIGFEWSLREPQVTGFDRFTGFYFFLLSVISIFPKLFNM